MLLAHEKTKFFELILFYPLSTVAIEAPVHRPIIIVSILFCMYCVFIQVHVFS